MSFATRCLDFETLHHHFGHISDKIIHHVFNNVEDIKKICFLTQKYVCYGYTLENIHQFSFPENSIYSDLFELPTLSYSKYKWVITFLNDYSFYCNIIFLYKKFEAAEAVKSTFQMWLNTTSHPIKKLHTNNRTEYITLELKAFLRKQEIIHETSIPYVY